MGDMATSQERWLSEATPWLQRRGVTLPQYASESERSDFQRCFDLIDADANGRLTADELHNVLTVKP